MIDRKAAAVSVLLLGAFIVAACTLLWLLFAPVDVVTITHNDRGNAITITDADGNMLRAHRGEPVEMHISYCKHLDLPATARAWLELEGALIELAADWHTLKPQCPKEAMLFVVVPASLSAESTALRGTGLARVKVYLEYHINPARTTYYELYSDYFKILE